MSQPTTWGVPRVADAPQTPEQFADRADDSFDALLDSHSGTDRPAYATAGTLWRDTDTNRWYLYDGTNDHEIPFLSRSPAVLESVSGSNTITATLTPALTAYTELVEVLFVAAGTNTGAVTLNVDSLGAKAVVKAGGAALSASDLSSGEAVKLWYDVGNDRFQVIGM